MTHTECNPERPVCIDCGWASEDKYTTEDEGFTKDKHNQWYCNECYEEES